MFQQQCSNNRSIIKAGREEWFIKSVKEAINSERRMDAGIAGLLFICVFLLTTCKEC